MKKKKSILRQIFILYFLQVKIEAYLPRSNSDVQITSRSTSDRSFIAVNDRPVYLKDLDKVMAL